MGAEMFKAMIVREISDQGFKREISQKNFDDLSSGDLLVRVEYSSLNYKDALSATGHRGVTRRYPHTPGIDAAGVVVEAAAGPFSQGDEVIVTGYDLGMNTSGGFGQYIRVPASWAMKRPEKIDSKESMIYGTAGFTSALSVSKIETAVKPDQGDILVTGATGGVGSIAVGILSKMGYRVVAATGKLAEKNFLLDLGAKEVISRETMDLTSEKPLYPERWAGVVDTVGGSILETAIKSTKSGGLVTCCGMVASHELKMTVFPYILRGVTLAGINSAECPMDIRLKIWDRIAREWKLDQLDTLCVETTLEDLSPKIDQILEGRLKGRVIVNLKD